MSRELLNKYFEETDPFFNKSWFNRMLDFAEASDYDLEKHLRMFYREYAMKDDCLLLPYAVIRMLFVEIFPELGDKYIKAQRVRNYLNNNKDGLEVL